MVRDIRRREALKFIGAGLATLSAGSGNVLAAPGDLREPAKNHVATEHNVRVSDLDVVAETIATWSTIDERYYNPKVRDSTSGDLFQALLDGDGNPVDRERLNRREEEKYREKYGKLGRRLSKKIENLPVTDSVNVILWLDGINHDEAKRAVFANTQSRTSPNTKQELADEFTSRIKGKTETFANTVRELEEVEVLQTGYVSPTIDVKASVAALQKLQDLPEVWRVFDRDVEKGEPLDSASDTHGTYDGSYVLYDCAGLPTGHIEFNHPWDLASVNFAGKRWSGDGGDHPTSTLEAQASNDSSLPGTAFNADVYSADMFIEQFADRMEWFGSNNVCAVNASVSTGGDDRIIDPYDFKIDSAVRNQWFTFAVSVGNGSGYALSPSVGFNSISVTSIDDKNTSSFGDDEWAGDRSLDPHTKNSTTDTWYHEKPEVAAVGVSVTTPFRTAGGTSMASPLVAGLATSMVKTGQDHGTVDLRYYPEVIKAMMTAGAVHDDFSTEEKIGYGVPAMDYLEPIIANGWYKKVMFDQANSSQSYSFSVDSGESVRVALVFISDSVDSDFSDNKDAQADIDLDLEVATPSGTVHSSYAYDTALEFVEFSTSQSGTCDITVNKFRWDSSDSSRYMGIAWHRQ